jgi:urea transport system substrate-binding protein
VAFSVGEQELSTTDTRNLVGHLAAWNYFMSDTSKENKAFIKQWHEYTKDPKRVTNDPMEATMIGFNMWIKAVEEAKTTEVDKVIDALIGIKVPNLTGGTAVMLKNHHITKPVLLGEIQANGQFKIIWRTKNEIAGDAWSNYLTDSKNLISDWTKPIDCGNYDKVAKSCKTGSFLDWLNKRIF